MAQASSIYSFLSYSEYLRWWIAQRPKAGRGEMAKMAAASGVSAALFSQIMSGDRQFSTEGGLALAEYLALPEKETDYLLLMIDHERAGTAKLKSRVLSRLKEQQAAAAKVSNRIRRDGELDPETRATYYSSWTYTAIRNLTAVEGFQTVDAIAERLALPRAVVARVIDFLLETGLCRLNEKGGVTYGPSWTHVGSDSRLVTKHHQNWRVRALTKMETGNEEDLFFTSPMSLSHETAREIRRMLPDIIEKIQKMVGPSESQTVRCLNIDWFDY